VKKRESVREDHFTISRPHALTILKGFDMNPMARIGLILFLVIFQTTIYYTIPALNHFVDLLIIFVIYAGLFLPLIESIVLSLVLGALMDSITGGLFGLYLSIYFWIIVGLRPFVTLLNLKNTNTLRLLLGIAIVFENLMLFIGTVALKQEIVFSTESFRGLTYQLVWTLVLGPFLIWLLIAMDRQFKMNAQSK
jgi:cell shape-determining protein MreD